MSERKEEERAERHQAGARKRSPLEAPCGRRNERAQERSQRHIEVRAQIEFRAPDRLSSRDTGGGANACRKKPAPRAGPGEEREHQSKSERQLEERAQEEERAPRLGVDQPSLARQGAGGGASAAGWGGQLRRGAHDRRGGGVLDPPLSDVHCHSPGVRGVECPWDLGE